MERNSGRSQTDSEALPLVRDERGEALRVIDSMGSLVKNLLHDLKILLSRWLERDTGKFVSMTCALVKTTLWTIPYTNP